MPTRLRLTYYPWITQSISGPELAAAIRGFRDLLLAELRSAMGNEVELELLNELEVPDQLNDIKEPPSGGLVCKIGLLNPIGYALARSQTNAVEAIVVVRRKIGNDPAGPTYKAQIYTHVKTAIRKLDQVRGRTLGFGSPQSTSNFLVPAMMLLKANIHPLNGLARVEFTGGHDKAAKAVYEGRLEVGAGHDGVIFDLASKAGYGDAECVLSRLAWSDDIPSDPIAVHSIDRGVRDQVAQALLKIAKPDEPDSAGNKSVLRFWGTKEGFERIGADDYAILLDQMKPLGLRLEDMLRKL